MVNNSQKSSKNGQKEWSKNAKNELKIDKNR